jgi:hypothetical protein
MKVGVCVPCRDEVMTSFAFDFAKMVAYDVKTRCAQEGHGLMMYTMPGTLIFDQREKLVDVALSEGCDAVLFIDSDMRFPKDMVNILISREVGIVGVNATTRRPPILPTALNLHIEEKDGNKSHWWEKIDSRGKEGIEKVTAIGFGAVMIRKEVFESIPKPWFDAPWGVNGIIGEDVHFCIKAFDAGHDTYVDHELSMHIGHVGAREHRWADVEDETLKEFNNGPN